VCLNKIIRLWALKTRAVAVHSLLQLIELALIFYEIIYRTFCAWQNVKAWTQQNHCMVIYYFLDSQMQ